MNFFTVRSLPEVQSLVGQLADRRRTQTGAPERLDLGAALGRICAHDLLAPFDLPEFRRSTVDGYAVRSTDVGGATETIPTTLESVGEIRMGMESTGSPAPGKTIAVPTGGMLPADTDAVVMVEHTENLGPQTLLIHKPVAPGENVVEIGDDLRSGETIVAQGGHLGPAEIGLLAGLGFQTVPVFPRPRVAVISTGDELVEPGLARPMGRIYDMNGPALAAATYCHGGQVISRCQVADDPDLLRNRIASQLDQADCIIVSGGSSIGSRDHTRPVLESLPESQILVHGIALKPGKPTIIATVGSTVVFGLPGHPAAAMLVFQVVVLPFLKRLTASQPSEYRVTARLDHNVHAAPGRTTLQLVQLYRDPTGWRARPLHGQSGLLSVLSRASGYVLITAETEGLMKNELAEVIVFQQHLPYGVI